MDNSNLLINTSGIEIVEQMSNNWKQYQTTTHPQTDTTENNTKDPHAHKQIAKNNTTDPQTDTTENKRCGRRVRPSRYAPAWVQ